MRKVFYALLLIVYVYTIGCKRHIDFDKLPGGLLAEEAEGKIEFIIDTTDYKEFLANKLFEDKNVILTKIEVKKQNALGSGDEFYYVYLSNADNTIKIGRWLNKIGNHLYLNDNFEEGSLFEQYYLICKGDGDCGPQVYQQGDERKWGCSTDLKCYKPNPEIPPSCKVFKSYIEPYKE